MESIDTGGTSGHDSDTTGEADDARKPIPLWFLDRDGDGHGDPAHPPRAAWDAPGGYVALADDCDDTDSQIYPGAEERCDGIDEDCDSAIDDDAVDAEIWYADADLDGYGGRATGLTRCEAPDGYLADATDCDDTDPANHPGAEEVCGDDVDNDCDGEVDEVPADYDDWRYPDLDLDRYGDASAPMAACTAPAWYIEAGGDCDDSDAFVRPGMPEFCDGVDRDCDGLIDSDDPDNTSVWYVDLDGDGFGVDKVEVDGCDAPDGTVAEEGDCDDEDAGVSPAAIEVCGDEVDEDCDGLASDCGYWGDHNLSEVETTYVGLEPQSLGDTLAAAGDVDGDGLSDLWLGAPNAAATGLDRGAVYLVLGGTPAGTAEDVAAATLEGASDYAEAGWSHRSAGDVDGDGYLDLWVGALYDLDPDDGEYVGSASLVLGPFTGTIALSDADMIWRGIDTNDQAGYKLATDVDLDEDGTPDALVSANRREFTDGSKGSVYVLYSDGRWGSRSLLSADVELVGELDHDQLGRELASCDDLSGDGVPDALISSTANDAGGGTAGAVYVLSDTLAAGTYDIADVTHRIVGHERDLALGSGLASVSDLNDDGYGDIAVGASGDSTAAESGGAIFVLHGPADDVDSSADASAKLVGVEEDELAVVVDGGKDIDADGWSDLVVGAYSDGGGGSRPGKAYLVRGPLVEGTSSLGDSGALYLGEQEGSYAGHAVAMVGDTDGDGYSDVVIGAPHTGADSEGSVYLLPGAAFGE